MKNMKADFTDSFLPGEALFFLSGKDLSFIMDLILYNFTMG